MWTPVLCQISNSCVDIFNVIDQRSIRMSETIIDGCSIAVHLCISDDLRCVADMLAINFAQCLNRILLLQSIGRTGGRPRDP